MFRKKVFVLLICLFAITMLGACSGESSDSDGSSGNGVSGSDGESEAPAGSPAASSGDGQQDPENKQQNTLQVKNEPYELYFLGSTDLERFLRDHGNDLTEKFPHVTIHYYQLSGSDNDEKGQLSIQGALTRGIPLDIIHLTPGNIQPYLVDTALAYDVEELVKKYNYDMKIAYPQAIETLRSASDGKLYGLPVNHSIHKLYYNIDLFEKFGEDFPRDGMTWDEMYDLAKKMTRVVDGQPYYGAVIPFSNLMLFNQLSVGFVDPDTKRSLFVSDPRWAKFVNNLVRFKQIPGNETTNDAMFTRDGTAAMLVATYDLNATWSVNWDMAQAPVFPDLPGVGSGIQGNLFALASTSKDKDTAFQIIAFLASREHMLDIERGGGLTVLSDPEKKKTFGTAIPWLDRDIHLAAMFQDSIADSFVLTPYDSIAQRALAKQMDQLAQGLVPDVNTALRLAAEEADKEIEQSVR